MTTAVQYGLRREVITQRHMQCAQQEPTKTQQILCKREKNGQKRSVNHQIRLYNRNKTMKKKHSKLKMMCFLMECFLFYHFFWKVLSKKRRFSSTLRERMIIDRVQNKSMKKKTPPWMIIHTARRRKRKNKDQCGGGVKEITWRQLVLRKDKMLKKKAKAETSPEIRTFTTFTRPSTPKWHEKKVNCM